MRAKLVCCFLLLSAVHLSAQTVFSVDSNFQKISRTNDFGILHGFFQLSNHTDDTIAMRWRKNVSGRPPAWDVNLQDPQNHHMDLSIVDSADFLLPDSASSHTTNKIVIGVDHHGLTGSGSYAFTLFRISDPADSATLTFQIEVLPSGVAISEARAEQANLYPNPAQERICLEEGPISPGQISMTDFKGNTYFPPFDYNEQKLCFDVKALPQGAYFLRLEHVNRTIHYKFLISR